jgi:transcriptional regulator with XRE-family HTH domain
MDTEALVERIAKRLHELKRSKKYTQKDLARDLGITPGAVNQWLTKRTGPPVDKLKDIALALDMDILELAPDAPLAVTLSNEEECLIRRYRSANSKGRTAINSVSEVAAEYREAK